MSPLFIYSKTLAMRLRVSRVAWAVYCSLRLRAVSLFSWSVEKNERDTQMTTSVTEGARTKRESATDTLSSIYPPGDYAFE